jgi:glyoxylase-like metal-dependent hydrolase (beta-lactamase superfamily II)
MRIVRLHPDDSNDYCCNLYWVVSDSNLVRDFNTLVDAGSSRAANMDFLAREMEKHSKGIGRRAVEQVVLTHFHYDHVGGLQALVDLFHPKVFAFRREEGVDLPLLDGSWLRMGDKDFRVLHTPGHSEDSICLFCPETGDLFSGDTLYRISDAEGSYPECYVRSLERIADLKVKVIYPGHGEPIHNGIRGFIDDTIRNVSASLLH